MLLLPRFRRRSWGKAPGWPQEAGRVPVIRFAERVRVRSVGKKLAAVSGISPKPPIWLNPSRSSSRLGKDPGIPQSGGRLVIRLRDNQSVVSLGKAPGELHWAGSSVMRLLVRLRSCNWGNAPGLPQEGGNREIPFSGRVRLTTLVKQEHVAGQGYSERVPP
jgi:hypothetical protein